jgi:hypothetical protein
MMSIRLWQPSMNIRRTVNKPVTPDKDMKVPMRFPTNLMLHWILSRLCEHYDNRWGCLM